MDQSIQNLIQVCKEEETRLQGDIASSLNLELCLFDDVMAGIRGCISEEGHEDCLFTRYQAVIASLFCKLILTCRAIRVLCASGYGVEAQVLLRSALEVLITMKFIGQTSPEERAKLWSEFDHVLAWQYAKKAERWPSTFRQSDLAKRIAVLRERYEQVKANYPGRRFWAETLLPQGGLGAMAEQVGLRWYYDFVYWSGSNQSHGNVRSSREYVEKAEDGRLSFRIAPTAEHSSLPVESATALMIWGFESFCNASRIQGDQRIDGFVQAFAATYSRALPPNDPLPPSA